MLDTFRDKAKVKTGTNILKTGVSIKDNLKTIQNFFDNALDEARAERAKIPEHIDGRIYDFFKSISMNSLVSNPDIESFPIIFVTKPPITIFGQKFGTYSHVVDSRKQEDTLINEFTYFYNTLTHAEASKTNWLKNFTVFFRSIEIPDLVMNIESTITNLQKEKHMHPTFFTGHNGATTNMTLLESDGLENLKTVKAWYDYIRLTNLGYLSPSLETIMNHIIDYKANIYVMKVRPNLKEVTFFAKFTGVFPTKVPLSAQSLDIENIEVKKLNIEFSYDYFEFMNNEIVDEFNILAGEMGIKLNQTLTNSRNMLQLDVSGGI